MAEIVLRTKDSLEVKALDTQVEARKALTGKYEQVPPDKDGLFVHEKYSIRDGKRVDGYMVYQETDDFDEDGNMIPILVKDTNPEI